MDETTQNELTPEQVGEMIEETPSAGSNEAAAPEEADTGADHSVEAAPATGHLEAAATVEAILFSSDAPLTPAKLAQIAELPGQKAVRQAVATLNERYEQTRSSFRIESVAGGYQMLTLPEYHDVLARLYKTRSESKLSQAAMETLAIIAYRQPILRADIEAIRGVACGEVLRGLMEKQMVKIVGRAEILGRPMLYGTTRRFLETFGLNDLQDLPRVEELRGGANASGQTSAKPADAAPAAETPAPADASAASPALSPEGPVEEVPQPAPSGEDESAQQNAG
jgi:segregation and condensation protein B